jgi:hypothetical protein
LIFLTANLQKVPLWLAGRAIHKMDKRFYGGQDRGRKRIYWVAAQSSSFHMRYPFVTMLQNRLSFMSEFRSQGGCFLRQRVALAKILDRSYIFAFISKPANSPPLSG